MSEVTFTDDNFQETVIEASKSKPVLVDFFATWCGPCREELPHLQKEVYDKLKNNKDFVLLIFGREHSWEEIDKFTTEQNFTMPFYPDPERKIFSIYANQNIPRNFIIEKKGDIALASVGYNKADFKKIIGKVEELLK